MDPFQPQPLMAIPGLLDDSYITGIRTISRTIGPYRYVVYVDPKSYADAVAAVAWACQCWGGAGFLLVPWGGATFAEPWARFVRSAGPDFSHSFVGNDTSSPLEGMMAGGDPVSALAALLAIRSSEGRTTVQVTDLPLTDPWHLAHVGVLGAFPPKPDLEILRNSHLRTDISFDDLLDLHSIAVAHPARGLIAALSDRSRLSCALLSLIGLVRFPCDTLGFIGDIPGPLPPPADQAARRCGTAIVVLYHPGRVDDLCLLWNLRAAAGHPNGFPLAIPLTESIPDAFAAIRDAARDTGLELSVCRPVTITGFSAQAQEYCAANGFTFVAPSELLRAPRRPARPSSDVVAVQDGSIKVAAWDSRDRTDLRFLEFSGRGGIVSHIELQPGALPPLLQLENHDSFPWRSYVRGGWEMPTDNADLTAEFIWPSGWRALTAAAEEHGLLIEPSAPGRAAVSLLRRIGSLDDIGYFLHPPLVEVLDELCQAAGISWFRDRLRELHRKVRDDFEPISEDRILSAIHSLAGTAHGREGSELSYDEIRERAFQGQGKRAKVWLEWATGVGILLRGVLLECTCTRKSWTPLGGGGLGLPCSGCGQPLSQALPTDHLPLRYRAAELLIDVGRHDALVHLITMRWMHKLFGRTYGFGGAGLYGAFPGVVLRERVGGQHLAEIDLLLLMRDGLLIPGECKRRAAGLRESDIEKLERVSERLGSPWSFLATLDTAQACDEVWTKSLRELPARPRFALTAEQLFPLLVLGSLGENPFLWNQPTSDELRLTLLDFLDERGSR